MPETIWGVADYYELLEVARSATPEQIRAAITAQRRIWVRRQSSPDLERRAEAEQRVVVALVPVLLFRTWGSFRPRTGPAIRPMSGGG